MPDFTKDGAHCLTKIPIFLINTLGQFGLIGLIGYVICSPFDSYNFIIGGITVTLCLLAIGIVRGLKLLVDWLNKKCNTHLETRIKIDMIVGLVAISIISTAARILVFYIDYDPHIEVIATVAFLFTITFLYYTFLVSFSKDVIIKYYPKNKTATSLIFLYSLLTLHFILLFISMKTPLGYDNRQQTKMILRTQSLCTLIMYTSTIDLAFLICGGIEIKEKPEWKTRRPIRREASSVRLYDGTQTAMDIVIYCYSVVTVAVLATLFVYTAFHWTSGEAWIATGSILIFSLALYGALRLVKDGLGYINKKLGTLEKYTIEMLIGLGGMMLSGLTPRILVFVVDANVWTIGFGAILPIISALIFYQQFVYRLRKICYFHYENHKILITCILIINALILTANIQIAMNLESEVDKNLQIWVHGIYAVIFALTMMDLGVACCGGLKLRDPKREKLEEKMVMDDVERPAQKRKLVAPEVKKILQKIQCPKCPKCKKQYNDSQKVPRTLKECGHSICEECADVLLKEKFNQYLSCPTCKEISVVKGPASLLCKNYAALELLQTKEDNSRKSGS